MNKTAALLLLTWTSGTADGLSYIGAHVFTANMTGNTVLLGMYAVHGQTSQALHSLAALGAFVLGCAVAAAVFPGGAAEHTAHILRWAARIEFVLFGIFAYLWGIDGASPTHALSYSTILVAGVALGIQSVAVRRLRIWGVVTTFITGTITASIIGSISALRSRMRTGHWPRRTPHVALLAAMFVIYVAAAASAAYLSSGYDAIAAILPLPPLIPVMFLRKPQSSS
jgi:uncharacterized membrane protein YoaK (UPF0700 family)